MFFIKIKTESAILFFYLKEEMSDSMKTHAKI